MKSHLQPGVPWVQATPTRQRKKKKMSKYIELQTQIAELQAQLQDVREAEFEPEVADIKKRIAAFGIKPQDLFTPAELGAPTAERTRVRRPPKYELDGHVWSGQGAMPKWYTAAIAAGVKPEDLLIKS